MWNYLLIHSDLNESINCSQKGVENLAFGIAISYRPTDIVQKEAKLP